MTVKQIEAVLTKLFLYLDERQWELLRQEVLSGGMVVMNNGEGPTMTSGADIVEHWRANLEAVDAIYHQLNPYCITFTVRFLSVYINVVCVVGDRWHGDRLKHARERPNQKAPTLQGSYECTCLPSHIHTHTHTTRTTTTGRREGKSQGLRVGDALQGRGHTWDTHLRRPLQLRALPPDQRGAWGREDTIGGGGFGFVGLVCAFLFVTFRPFSAYVGPTWPAPTHNRPSRMVHPPIHPST